MDFKELCEKRYSCRAYQDRKVEADKMEYVLECARLAPSAVNKQPWRVRVVTSDPTLEKVWQAYNREWIRTAPAVIAVSVNKAEAWTRADGKCHADIDGAIFVEHLCLAAASIGLGTCWVCNFDDALCREIFKLDADEEMVALMPIGYPADEPKAKSRKRLLTIDC